MCVKSSQGFDIGIGAGIGLEIRYVFSAAGFVPDPELSLLYLAGDALGGIAGKFAAASLRTEYTSAPAYGPVPVRTGEAPVQRQLVNLTAKSFPQIFIQQLHVLVLYPFPDVAPIISPGIDCVNIYCRCMISRGTYSGLVQKTILLSHLGNDIIQRNVQIDSRCDLVIIGENKYRSTNCGINALTVLPTMWRSEKIFI